MQSVRANTGALSVTFLVQFDGVAIRNDTRPVRDQRRRRYVLSEVWELRQDKTRHKLSNFGMFIYI